MSPSPVIGNAMKKLGSEKQQRGQTPKHLDETPRGYTQTLMSTTPAANMIEIALPKPASTIRALDIPSSGPIKLTAAMMA